MGVVEDVFVGGGNSSSNSCSVVVFVIELVFGWLVVVGMVGGWEEVKEEEGEFCVMLGFGNLFFFV